MKWSNQYRLPTVHAKIKLHGLASAPELNGERANVVRYEKDTRLYRVKLSGPAKTQLAVKPANVLLLDDPREQEWNDRLLHLFIPCHSGDARRLDLFRECARSIVYQEGRCRVFVGVSSGNQELKEQAIDILRQLSSMERIGANQQWYVKESATKMSQFRHFQALMPISLALNPEAWIIFLDNDDMYQKYRVSFLHSFLSTRHHDPNKDVICCPGKLLIDVKKSKVLFGDNVLAYQQFDTYDDALRDLVSVAATVKENMEKHATEYFDLCVRSNLLQRFLEFTPGEILDHRYCDVCFHKILGLRGCIVARHPAQDWLLMHYRVRRQDIGEAFQNSNIDIYNNALVSVSISKEDRRLSDETGVSPEMIAYLRSDVEEAAIQLIEFDHALLEKDRKELLALTSYYDLKSKLWESTCMEFSSCSSKDQEELNRAFCREKRATTFVEVKSEIIRDNAF